MLVTHLGHSCLLVEVADQRILLDPGGFTPGFETQRDLDAIIVTHQHPDHLDRDRLPQLLQNNPRAALIVESMTYAILREAGIDSQELRSGSPFQLGDLQVEPVGTHHAVIHADIPRIDNTGVLLRAAGEPVLFHPGDALDVEPGPVDVLCVPINAPWCAMKETVEFVRRIASARFVPIHDGLLQPRGRNLYLTQIGNLAGEGTRVADLAGRGAIDPVAG